MEDQIPAGAEVPETTGETTPQTGQVANQAQPDVAAMQNQITNLEKLVGRQGEELGQYRQQAAPAQEDAQPSLDELETQIMDKLDEGDIDINEAMKQVAQIASQRGAEAAVNQITQNQQQQQSDAAIASFMDQHPDFAEMRDSGSLQSVIDENPIHDDVSAYFALKADQAENAGKQKGMQIASESTNASKVIGKSGDTQQQTQQPQTRASVRQAMMAKLSAVRNGG